MRSRDEVLLEFPVNLQGMRDSYMEISAYHVERMADRIRELESQQTVSEPVGEPCYGCEVGLPLNDGLHHNNGWTHTPCTADHSPNQSKASEPVASVSEIESLLNDAVGHAMDYARGDNHATNKHEASWNEALTRIRALAKPHPSAAGVTVTDAMVEAVFRSLCADCGGPIGGVMVDGVERDDIRNALTAALTDPTTPTRGSDE